MPDGLPLLQRTYEELESLQRDMAQILASYYTELIRQGLPGELAGQIIINFHDNWVKAILGNAKSPNSP